MVGHPKGRRRFEAGNDLASLLFAQATVCTVAFLNIRRNYILTMRGAMQK